MIRPFFMLAYAHNLRMVMNSMFKGMAAVTYIGTLLLFHLIIFAIIGTKFFAKVSPTEFGTFYRSCISLFTLLTTANYPNVMLNAMDSSLFNVIFFIVFLVVGLFIFLNLALATVFNSYKERIEHDLLVHKNRAKIAFQAAFKLCDPEGTGAVEKQIFVLVFKYLRPNLSEEELEALFSIADMDRTNKIEHENFGVVVVLYNIIFTKKRFRIEARRENKWYLRWLQLQDQLR
mmetsp:Transcript_6977/g.10840  ORF Transcript_6977/g.10840 Transcript_6977/m.10840 type:complete len:232 (-) Transcript_6977:1399-2094(-)